jgi:uncharacterized membrane protein YvlD (DUF360 family)
MNYFRSLLLNFLIVFFVDRVAPGVEISYYEQVPNIGADILFSAFVGFFNASVFPFLAILELNPTNLKLALITGVISFLAFILIAIFPFGVSVVNPLGVIVGGGAVWLVAYVTNHLEFKRDSKK